MWILFAFGSALFAGLTSILAKCGIRKTDSDTATAIRTIVVLLFSWLMVAIVGSAPTITGLSAKTWVFLILSGLATGASWLCYFRALQLGDVNKVVPIDKSSTILTIALAFLFLGEGITWLKGAAVVLNAVEQKLGIVPGAITPDGKFSLDSCRCVGACGLAPVMMINNDVYGRLTPDQVGPILDMYK